MPSLNNLNSGSPLDFSVISDQHPHNRVDYVEGEVLELVVPSSGDFNYAVFPPLRDFPDCEIPSDALQQRT